MNSVYNFTIIGSGFFGSICARELTDAGYKCLVVDKRKHIGGNCYTEQKDGIHIHSYGPHIFHTSNDTVWNWINRYCTMNPFIFSPVADYMGKVYSLPFNMWTFNQMWGVTNPEQVKKRISIESSKIDKPSNFEEQAIKTVGVEIYEKLIKGYTEKQWRKDPKLLPASIIKRLPVRFTYNNNYFNDKYQGIPSGGYTQIFEKLLDGIDVELGVDYLDNKEHYDSLCDNVIYTGPIDAYFDYKYGSLEYKTTMFEHEIKKTDNHQGCPVINYTERDVPYTRTIEHKHFDWVDTDVSWVTKEYPVEYIPGVTDPYYPVNDNDNNERYLKYLCEAKKLNGVYFGGRLAEYKYYDMDNVIVSALNKIKSIINEKEHHMPRHDSKR